MQANTSYFKEHFTKTKRILRSSGMIIIIGILSSSLLLFVILDLIIPLPEPSRSYSTLVYSSEGVLIHGFLSTDDKWRMQSGLDDISSELVKTIIFKEDKYFFYHPGVNLFSICRALYYNLITGKRTSGASTITMQLSRMLNPAPRTYWSKTREIFRAMQLEFHYTKKEVLAMYLNLLPYGGNIEGVKAAALIYFDQSPKELSPGQMVLLTVIPNNPNVLSPQNRKSLLKSRDFWLTKMGEQGIFTPAQVQDALLEDFESKRYSIPRLAPHLANRLHATTSDNTILTHIHLPLQTKAEVILRNYIRGLRTMQINNASILVINNRTMSVEAYIGSAGFNENQFSGQVDGIQAIRSPGSTLKPLLYMLAFDKGLVSPKTRVTDVPVNYNGYRPENYDESYRGKVSIEQALALSLNVPAVNLLEQMGLNELTTSLSRAGFKWVDRNKSRLGLSLILGGGGTTLEELTTLYASFANGGVWRPASYMKNEAVSDSSILGSKGSNFMITEILTSLKRPDLPNQYQMAADLPMVAWKTGTSYGRRDGWAIGYNQDYTVGVWTGNFEGNGIPELNGTDCAVPLLFSLFNNLSTQNADWFVQPEEMDFRLVCSETGMVPDTFCHNVTMENYLPGISPSIRCDHMKAHLTNGNETVLYCRDCLPEAGYKAVLYPYYEPVLVSYYDEMNIPYKRLPEHNPSCNSLEKSQGPLITSLTNGAEYLVIAGRKQNLMLKSSCDQATRDVYWYIDKKFFKKASVNEQVYFEAIKGKHEITCSDDRGRWSTINILVSVL